MPRYQHFVFDFLLSITMNDNIVIVPLQNSVLLIYNKMNVIITIM